MHTTYRAATYKVFPRIITGLGGYPPEIYYLLGHMANFILPKHSHILFNTQCMKNWIKWTGSTLVAMGIISLMFICITQCPAQSFELINQYPYVVTEIKYDSFGNEFVIRQQGSLTENGDTIKILPVKFVNESGLISFTFAPNGFFLHLTSPDNAQRIIEYDTISGTLDTILTVPYTNPLATIHRGGSVIYSEIDSIPTLLASFGDGSISMSAQNLDDFRGKLIKIPQMSDSTWGFGEIVLFGLRNPYRFDYNLETGQGFITDVGSNVAEEVNNFRPEYSLLNLMWPCAEGDSILIDLDSCGGYAISYPEYTYSQAPPRAIIGGCFWNTNYYFCDAYSGIGGSLDTLWNYTEFPILFPIGVTSMTTNNLNELIVSTYNGGIYKYHEGPLSIDEEIPQENGVDKRGIVVDGKWISWGPKLVGKLYIYSIEGKVVYVTNLAGEEYFQLADLPQGFYIIAVYTDRGLEYSHTFVNIR